MVKLFQLKRWLTVPEAAKHLSTIFGEDVSEVDIYRLALDHRLTLSVVFVESALASICKPIEDADVVYNEVPTLSGEGTIKLPVGGQITYAPDGRMLQVQCEIFHLDSDEPYDLTMMGGERADIERKYWQLAGRAVIDTTNLDGTFLSDGAGGNKRFFQLKGELATKKGDPRRFYPIGGLSEDAVIVVTSRALLALEKSIGEQATNEEKSLSTTEPVRPLASIEPDIDPSDLPEELDAANMAFRAVLNGYGEQTATFKNRLIDYLKANYSHLKTEAVDRIATVANPDKSRGRKTRDTK